MKGKKVLIRAVALALALILCLGVYACTLSGAGDGLKFYLVPSLTHLKESGVWTVISAAMGQAFFTLSVGIGSIASSAATSTRTAASPARP